MGEQEDDWEESPLGRETKMPLPRLFLKTYTHKWLCSEVLRIRTMLLTPSYACVMARNILNRPD